MPTFKPDPGEMRRVWATNQACVNFASGLSVPLAYTADTWTQVIVAFSIFGPLALAAALTIWVLRGKKNDPDAQRMRRAQDEYEARRDAEDA